MVFCDSYQLNSATGSFILIDPHSNGTVAAGMIRGEARQVPAAITTATVSRPVSTDTVSMPWNIPRELRESRQHHRAAVVWLTGLPGAGKTTISRAVEQELFARGCLTMLLDGDQLRQGLCGDLGFAPEDRAENIRRAGEVARLFFEQGAVVLCAFVSPYRSHRDGVRALLPSGRFLEVFVKADVETCRARDPKGHYARAAAGSLQQLTGVSAAYQEPVAPELTIDTQVTTVTASTEMVLRLLEAQGLIPPLQAR